MILNRSIFTWISMSMLLLSSNAIFAQCNPPDAFWLHAPQTSTAFTLNWSNVPGASQYDLRYWETSTPGDKTVLENFAPAPSTLSGLKKNTQYTLEIRSRCGNLISTWGNAVHYLTADNPGSCATPVGVVQDPGISSISVSWTSTGSHTIRYRPGTSGDWLIPSGGLSVSTSPYTITGLASGTYQIEVKRNCSGTSSDFINAIIIIVGDCSTPA
ncbi:MAG: fibronectin type III domain-containing protein, partial [Saprospiraceae bacterium]|nr:fibronectin type III domain-containing protein [Saprospiraceae bacterium]